jgi:DNA polymerase III subunit delta
MAGPSSRRGLRESDVKPGYVFHGVEMFFAHEFLRQLPAAIGLSDADQVSFETFSLSETPWRDILDVARTLSLFTLSPWRVLVVETDPDEAEEFTGAEEKMLRDYFAAPTPKTVVVVLIAGKVRKAHPLLKLFAAFSPSVVKVEEKKPQKGRDLETWLDERLAADGKRITPEARLGLIAATGNDLELLSRELDKLATYVGSRETIDIPDVNELSTAAREFAKWELMDSLEKGDIEECLRYAKKRFEEDEHAELLILSQIGQFFLDIQVAKAGLREKRSREEIFKELRPNISPNWVSLYQDKFRRLFRVADGFSPREISRLTGLLKRTDLMVKTTDTYARALVDAMIFAYGRAFRSLGLTSSGRT